MSVKCEEPIDELTVQVWLLYHHPNFKYCTLFVSGTEKRTDRRTNQLLDAPADLSGRGHKKLWPMLKFFQSRSKVMVKVTNSIFMVPLKRSCHKDHTCQI